VNISYSDWYHTVSQGESITMSQGEMWKRSISKWIEITPKRFTLEPDGYMEVKFTISPPDFFHMTPLQGFLGLGDAFSGANGKTKHLKGRPWLSIYHDPLCNTHIRNYLLIQEVHAVK